MIFKNKSSNLHVKIVFSPITWLLLKTFGNLTTSNFIFPLFCCELKIDHVYL